MTHGDTRSTNTRTDEGGEDIRSIGGTVLAHGTAPTPLLHDPHQRIHHGISAVDADSKVCQGQVWGRGQVEQSTQESCEGGGLNVPEEGGL